MAAVRDHQRRDQDERQITARPAEAEKVPQEMPVIGSIDDNQDRIRVVHSDLRDAIDAVLNAAPILHPRTLSFGSVPGNAPSAAPGTASAISAAAAAAVLLLRIGLGR